MIILILIIFFILLFLLLFWFLFVAKIIARNQCINNICNIFSISKDSATCLLNGLYKYNVSKETINNFCKLMKNESDVGTLLTQISAGDVKGIKQTFQECSIKYEIK